MKNIFKSFLTLASVAAVFASCVQEAKPLANSVSLDKKEVVFEGQNAPAQTVKVTADGDWFAVAPEWVTLEPAVGSGETEVKVSVADNVNEWKELSGPRSASVSFCYGTSGLSVLSVQQKGENGLDASRQYSKITKADEFKAGSYLIVFNYKEKDNALKAFNATSETYYSWLYGDEVTVVDGIVNMPNANNAYTFETAEGGYKIKMPNGRYLFQEASYNSFYSSDNVAKGDVWTVSFDEKGLATIKNITTADKWMQWTSYGSAGAYNSAQEGAVLPMLYKDSKPASDEVLSVPEKVSVVSNATTAKIAVTSNKTWKVRCHDEWIKEFTKSGEGNGEIVLTFTANESKTDARAASIQVIGETTNFVVEFIQNKIATSVAEISGQLISTDKNAQSPYMADLSEAGAVVSYVNGRSAYIEDKTGAILLYKNDHGLTAGQKVSGSVSGVGYLYSGLPELTSLEGAETSEGGEIPCTEITLADLLDNYNANLSRRVLIKGVEVTDAIDGGDRNGEVVSGGKKIAVYAKVKDAIKMPKGKCDIICFPALNNSTKELALWESAHCTYTEIAGSVSVNAVSLKVGGTDKVSYTTNNTEGAVTYSIDKTDIATVAADGTITAVAEGEATITVKVAAAGIYTAAEATATITVKAADSPVEKSEEIVLANGTYSGDGETGIITWSGTSCSFVQTKESSTTNVNSSYVSAPRWYGGNKVTFTANTGYTITKVVVVCTDAKYVTALKDSTYSDGASATVSDKTVTITTSGDFAVTMGAQSRISSVTVYYTE